MIDSLSPWLLAFAGLFGVLLAINSGRPAPMRAIEIAKGAAALIIIFAFLTGGRGCASGGPPGDVDCIPAGPGIYGC